MLYKTRCPICNGDGYTWEHSFDHDMHADDPNCYPYGCPVPAFCENCQGEGEVFEVVILSNELNIWLNKDSLYNSKV